MRYRNPLSFPTPHTANSLCPISPLLCIPIVAYYRFRCTCGPRLRTSLPWPALLCAPWPYCPSRPPVAGKSNIFARRVSTMIQSSPDLSVPVSRPNPSFPESHGIACRAFPPRWLRYTSFCGKRRRHPPCLVPLGPCSCCFCTTQSLHPSAPKAFRTRRYHLRRWLANGCQYTASGVAPLLLIRISHPGPRSAHRRTLPGRPCIHAACHLTQPSRLGYTHQPW
jgi:hypothetical protein